MSSFLRTSASSSYQTSSSEKVTRRMKVTKTIQKTLPDGRVVTETTTEYQEVQDDKESVSPKEIKEHHGFSPKALFQKKPKAVEAEEKSDSSSDEEEDFAEEALKSHNEYRRKHGVPALKLSKKLNKYAKEWAEHLAAKDLFEHRGEHKYGENIYCSWSSNPKAKCSGKTPVDSWYSEISKYKFGGEPSSMGTGHFTQVVWKSSEKLGIAVARSASGKFLVVANYSPPGNMLGQYAANVPPPK